jgi:hypothetical protein
MAGPRNYAQAVVNVELLVADVSRAILAAAGAQSKYLIYKLIYTSTTSAAFAVTIASATINVAKIGSLPGVTQYTFEYGDGIELLANEALNVIPAAAGPGAWVTVVYAKLPLAGNA